MRVSDPVMASRLLSAKCEHLRTHPNVTTIEQLRTRLETCEARGFHSAAYALRCELRRREGDTK